MNFLKKLFAQKPGGNASVRRVTAKDPLVIESPRIGFLNLVGSTAQAIVEADKAVLAPMFRSCVESNAEPPFCDVLMAYVTIFPDGRIGDIADGLGEMIRNSKAAIVILASENQGASYIAASKQRKGGAPTANLVMTLGRKGTIFAQFLKELFGKMFSGTTMPVAWVELAPQIPGSKHENVPETIFAAEISHIIFRR
jgi:hypothetical protein